MASDSFNTAAKPYGAADLFAAIESDDAALVKKILSTRQVADFEQVNDTGWTPLLLAISRENTDCIGALLDAGADVNAREKNMGHTPLARAVGAYYGGKPQVVSLLLSRGADPSILPINANEGPLLVAAEKGYETITLMLLSKGANVEQEDDWGRTAVHTAAAHGHAGVIRILADHGADLNRLGAQALSKAISNHSREVFDVLLDCGADPAAPLKNGKTLMMVAAECGETGIMGVLAEKGNDPDGADAEGKTALMHAAEKGKGESARKLMELGANPDIKTPEGLTARDIAVKEGHEHICYTIDNAPRRGAPAQTRAFKIRLAAKHG